MRDKGYDFPLYSLDLISLSSTPEDEPRFAIRLQKGRLVVRMDLRRRALLHTTDACDLAVLRGLAHHRFGLPGFAEYGLDEPWADNMQNWRERMLGQEALRLRLQGQGQLLGHDLRALLAQAQDLLRRLGLAQEMAGISGAGPAPRSGRELHDRLQRAILSVQSEERAGLLEDCGFRARHREELQQVTEDLRRLREELMLCEQSRREASATLLVMRGALIGDLLRLCRAAPHVLPPGRADALSMARLLPQRRPRRSPPLQTETAGSPDSPP